MSSHASHMAATREYVANVRTMRWEVGVSRRAGQKRVGRGFTLHLRLYRETARRLDSKERLGEVRVIRHGLQRLQSF